MLIHRFNPSNHLRTMDMLFDAVMPPRRSSTNFVRKSARLSLSEAEDSYTLRAELPGLTPDQLELSVGEDWLELRATRELELPEGYTALRRERGSYTLERRVNLAKRVKGEAVEAKLSEGVLTVTLPKQASAEPRQVAIAAA